MEWLQSKRVEVDPGWLRPELWRQCKARQPQPAYLMDRLLREAGYTVIRIPPYHPKYQPIELVWADVKRHNQARNPFKISVLPLI